MGKYFEKTAISAELAGFVSKLRTRKFGPDSPLARKAYKSWMDRLAREARQPGTPVKLNRSTDTVLSFSGRTARTEETRYKGHLGQGLLSKRVKGNKYPVSETTTWRI